MNIITEAQVSELSLLEGGVKKEKSKLRRDVETIEVGQNALFKNSGHDYHRFGQLYSAVRSVKMADARQFVIKQLSDKSGAVVTRTA